MLIHNLVATGSISYNGVNISYVTGSQTSLDGLNQFSASVNTTTGSLSSSIAILSGSYLTMSGSYSSASGSLSTRVTTIESKYATTGSNIFTGAQTVCANITSTGTIIAQTLNVQQVTSSIVYSSGSNIFGCSLSNTQQFTGSVTMTGSLSVFTAGTSPEFQVAVGGTTKGNALTDTHNVTGSLRITGSFNTIGNACITSICSPAIDVMPSGIGVSTLGGIMRVVTTGTSAGIAVGQSNANRYTHFAANDIQVFNDDFFLTTRCAFPLSIGTCYTARLTFAATGEACFSCQVCAPHFIAVNNISIGSSCTTSDGYNTRLRITCLANDTFVFSFNNQACKPIMFMYGGNTSNPQGYTAWVDNTTNNANHKLSHITTDATYFAAQGGCVGIGTTSPGTILTVEGANRAFPLTYNSGYGNIHIQTNETTATQNFGGTLTFGGLGRTSGPTEKFIWAAIAGRKQTTTSGDPKGYLQFGTLNDDTNQIAERMRITACGNVGIGITADNPIANGGTFRNLLVGNGAGYGVFQGISTATATDSTVAAFGGGTTGASGFKNAGSINIELDGTSTTNATGRIAFYTGTGGTIGERMRITSGGYLKVSNNGTYFSATSTSVNEIVNTLTDDSLRVVSTSTSYGGTVIQARANRNTTNNSFYFYQAYNDAAGANKLLIADSGNITNTNGSYGTISDIKLKENIVDASPKLEDILKLKVRNFNMIGDETKQIGFIAQEFEEVFPSMIEEHKDTDKDGNDLGTVTKSIKSSVLVPMLIKAIQEQQCKINILESCLGIN